jgi:hypothetical protein
MNFTRRRLVFLSILFLIAASAFAQGCPWASVSKRHTPFENAPAGNGRGVFIFKDLAWWLRFLGSPVGRQKLTA